MNLHKISFVLLIIGGLNWLLEGLFVWGIGDILGGPSSWLSRIVYILVGAAAVYELVNHKNICKNCDKGMAAPEGGMQ